MNGTVGAVEEGQWFGTENGRERREIKLRVGRVWLGIGERRGEVVVMLRKMTGKLEEREREEEEFEEEREREDRKKEGETQKKKIKNLFEK